MLVCLFVSGCVLRFICVGLCCVFMSVSLCVLYVCLCGSVSLGIQYASEQVDIAVYGPDLSHSSADGSDGFGQTTNNPK